MRRTGGNLLRVSSAGGPPTPVTHLETSRREFGHAWPQFLPDGRRFLYRIRSTQEEYTGIYLGSLDGATPPVRLVGADSNPIYTPGYLLFGREGRVFAQPFDAGRARVTGEPVPVADQVVHNPVTSRWNLAASQNGVLAYRTLWAKQLLWVDRTGHTLEPLGPVGQYTSPALSPTGDRVAVGRLDPRTGTEDIWVIETVRGTASRLTSDPAEDRDPVWSPDGHYIVFASNRSGHWELFKKVSDGSSAETLLFSGGLPTMVTSRPTDWSRDGRFVVFQSDGPNSDMTLWILPLTGDRTPIPFLQMPSREHQGQLSPDGRWVAYSSLESGSWEVYVRPFPPREGKWKISQGGGIEPKWRGDGAELFYLAPDGKLMSVKVRTTRGLVPDPPRPLFDAALSGKSSPVIGRNQYDVTADGQRFLVNRPEGNTAASPITVVVNWQSTLHP